MPPKHLQLRADDLSPDRPTVGIGPHTYRLRMPIDLSPEALTHLNRLMDALANVEDAESERGLLLAVIPQILYDPIDPLTLASLSVSEGADAINFFTSAWMTETAQLRAATQALLGLMSTGSPSSPDWLTATG